jgi:hypothetical protein
MPIEIKELIIKTTVEDPSEEPTSFLEVKEQIETLKREILEECEEMIRKILEKRDRR